MKVLLDENRPGLLKNFISSKFQVHTVHDCGWQSIKNGELLKAMTEKGID